MNAAANASAAPDAPGGQGVFLFWMSLAQLIAWGSTFYLFGMLIEPMEAHLGMSRAQSSMAFSLALLVEGAAAYAVGRWIDRGHARLVMVSGSLLAGVTLLAHTQVSSVAGFFALWATLGLAFSCTLYSPVFAVVTRRYPANYRRAIITITFLGGLASTVFIPLIAWLLARLGWQGALVVLACFSLGVCLPIHAIALRYEPARALPHPHETDADTAGPSVRDLVRHPAFWLIAVFSALGLAVTSAVPPHLIPLLRERGLDERWVVLVPASIGALQVFGRLAVFTLEHRWNVHRVNLVIVLLMPAAFVLLMAAGASPWLALLFAVVYGVANGTMTIVKGTAIATYVSRHHVAALNGLLGFPSAIARAVAPALVGALWSAQRGYRDGILALLGLSALACLAFFIAQRRALAHQAG